MWAELPACLPGMLDMALAAVAVAVAVAPVVAVPKGN